MNGPTSYHDEYVKCPDFWPETPGKYVRLLLEEQLTPGTVLDLGAGQGNNAIYLARNGFDVTAIEISDVAVNHFRNKLAAEKLSVRRRVKILHGDALEFTPDRQFQSVIAYGLLHCIKSDEMVGSFIRRMKSWTIDGGHNIVVALTNRLPVPSVQAYLEPIVVSEELLRNCYQEWSFRSFEHSVLTESHPTSLEQHQHSICRLLARRIQP